MNLAPETSYYQMNIESKVASIFDDIGFMAKKNTDDQDLGARDVFLNHRERTTRFFADT